MKKVVITGVTGQDGSFMVDHLLATTDCEIYGVVRRLSVPNHGNIEHVKDKRFHIVEADVADQTSMERLIRDLRPDYFINFAANSFVGNSWGMPMNHISTNFLGVVYQLEALREYAPHCRYYNAGSSEEWGNVDYSPQDEAHPMKPRSPYGVSKCAARMLVKVYRESYNMYAIQGHLLNHEGTRRGIEFLTRKVTKGVARISKALQEGKGYETLKVGNVEAKRDWSDAEDFVVGIWMMLNQEVYREDLKEEFENRGRILTPDGGWSSSASWLSEKVKEYVLSSNETHSIREFIEKAFAAADIKGTWVGEGLNEKFVTFGHPYTGARMNYFLVEISKDFYRPCEVELLHGDSSLARKELGWFPEVSFDQLVEKMVARDIEIG